MQLVHKVVVLLSILQVLVLVSLNNYCISEPQYLDYSLIENVYLVGDSLTINNNTSNQCNLYSDFTSISTNVTPSNSYDLSINLGTCHPLGFALLISLRFILIGILMVILMI